LNVYLYTIVPKGLFPTQDTGLMTGGIQADQAISFQAMSLKLTRIVDVVRRDPGVANVVAFTGGGSKNGGFIFVSLKPAGERSDVTTIMGRLRRKLASVPACRCSSRRCRTSAPVAVRRRRCINTRCNRPI
jgi:Cation/multidrug efflux pump